MKKILTIVFSFLLATTASAGCYQVGNLEGYSVREGGNFVISEDSITGQMFEVDVNGKNSSASDGVGSCKQVGNESTVVCSSFDDQGGFSLETWSIDLHSKKVVYTKINSGFEYRNLNGANLFVGDVVGKCD